MPQSKRETSLINPATRKRMKIGSELSRQGTDRTNSCTVHAPSQGYGKKQAGKRLTRNKTPRKASSKRVIRDTPDGNRAIDSERSPELRAGVKLRSIMPQSKRETSLINPATRKRM